MLAMIRDNLDTAISAVGLAVTLIIWVVDRFVSERRRINYRVHLNTKIGVTPRSAAGLVDLELRRGGVVVPDASIALIRVKNAGRLEVTEQDIAAPVSFTFPGRTVMGVDVVESSPPVLRDMILRDQGPTIVGEKLELPVVPLNRRDRFKLLVLLSGNGTDVRASGFVRGGVVERDNDRQRNRGLVFGGLALALTGLLTGLLIVHGRTTVVTGVQCASGKLTVEGSTAFAPVVTIVANEYDRTCGSAHVTVVANGSINGLRAVANAGAAGAKAAAGELAMSDGPASGEFGSLVARPVAVVVFTVVVNQSTGVHDLTLAQVRDIYAGRVTNWKQVGGADEPVRLVSRGSESGTRGAFERRVLGGTEPAVSSNDCLTKDRDPAAATTRCELATETDLLVQVSRTPGAIGYAERGAAATYATVNEVKLGGWSADLATVQRGRYPFWEVEYLYTYGTPAGGSLLSDFLDYTTLDTAKNELRADGFTPCVDRDQNLMPTLCRAGQ
jgi:phosphate binding protein